MEPAHRPLFTEKGTRMCGSTRDRFAVRRMVCDSFDWTSAYSGGNAQDPFDS